MISTKIYRENKCCEFPEIVTVGGQWVCKICGTVDGPYHVGSYDTVSTKALMVGCQGNLGGGNEKITKVARRLRMRPTSTRREIGWFIELSKLLNRLKIESDQARSLTTLFVKTLRRNDAPFRIGFVTGREMVCHAFLHVLGIGAGRLPDLPKLNNSKPKSMFLSIVRAFKEMGLKPVEESIYRVHLHYAFGILATESIEVPDLVNIWALNIVDYISTNEALSISIPPTQAALFAILMAGKAYGGLPFTKPLPTGRKIQYPYFYPLARVNDIISALNAGKRTVMRTLNRFWGIVTGRGALLQKKFTHYPSQAVCRKIINKIKKLKG